MAVFLAVTTGTSLLGAMAARRTSEELLLVRTCTDGPPFPWPNAHYAGPTVVAMLLGLGVAAAVLRRLVRRPRAGGIDTARDDQDRRETAAAVLAACAVLVAVPLASISLAAGAWLASGCDAGPVLNSAAPVLHAAGWVLLAVAAAASLIAFDALLALLLPGRPDRDPR